MTSQNTNCEFMRRNKNVNKRRMFKNFETFEASTMN